MLKNTMTYRDFDGVERTEDFYFNLTQAEIAEMEMSTDGGLEQLIQKIVNTKNVPEIIKMFKAILLKAYGQKSPDGRVFRKSKEISDEFSQTQAYSDLFMELATDEKAAAEFINGIVPSVPKGNVTALPAGN